MTGTPSKDRAEAQAERGLEIWIECLRDGTPGNDRDSRIRALRADGFKLDTLGEIFGLTRGRIWQICEGVRCPVDHKRIASRENIKKARAVRGPKPSPRIDGDGQFIREHYGKFSAAQIGAALGISKNAVIGAAYRMGLSASGER